MRKIKARNALLAVLIAAVLGNTLLFGSFTAFAEDSISVFLDGEKLEFDVPPTIINGSTMVPMRAIFEALGADVSWEDETKTAVGVKDGVTVQITIGSAEMHKNNSAIALNSPAVIINSKTLVPTRAIAESFGCDVSWTGETKTVYIYSINGNYSVQEDANTQEEYFGEPGDMPDEQFD